MICNHISFFMFTMSTITLLMPSMGCPFNLFCKHDNNMILELPAYPDPIKLLVVSINYTSKVLEARDPEICLPRLFFHHNFSSLIFPFWITSLVEWPEEPPKFTNFSFFDCSSSGRRFLRKDSYNSGQQDLVSCPIYMAGFDEDMVYSNLVSCTKLSQPVSPLILPEYSVDNIQHNSISLSWSETDFDKGCLECKHKSKKKIILCYTGVIIGSAILVLLFGGVFQIYRYFKMKDEDHTRIENFLKDYRALKPTRFSYADIKRITHNLKDKLGEGAHGIVYKGKLSNQIQVAVKILNNVEGDGKDFINEVGTMGKIHHINVVRLLGFCADGFRRALVYDYFPNGSLDKFISSPNKKDSFLGWDKLQQIALGIANGIEYLHQGCDQRILHFDINPHNVMLEDNFTPKITDFGLAKMCSKNQSIVSMTAVKGTLGYMAPEVFSRNFGNVSYKSDIYSYGMLLLEMVGGRKNTKKIDDEENIQIEYPEWIHNLVEGDIQISVDEEGDFRIARKMATVGLWCIQWHPMHRPTMKNVVQMLQGEGDKLKVPSNPFGPTTSAHTNSNTVVERMTMELDVIQELD